MPASTAQKAMARAREDFVWEMRVKGYTERSIVKAMEQRQDLWNKGKPLTPAGVHVILKRCNERYLAQINRNIEQIKLEHTAILQKNIEDLRTAYEKSTQAMVHQKKKTSAAVQTQSVVAGQQAKPGKAGYEQTEIGQKTQVGDHSILRELRETSKDIRGIWGADAPVKTESTVHGAMQVGHQDLSKLTETELQTLLAIQEKLAAPDHTQASTPAPSTSDDAGV